VVAKAVKQRAFWLVVTLMLIMAAPFISPHDPMWMRGDASFTPPSLEHPFGIDQFGRDVLSRTLHGGRATLLMSTGATAIAGVLGGMLGLLGAVDQISARPSRSIRMLARMAQAVNGALLALPSLLLALVVVTLLGSGAVSLLLATGISQLAPFAQLTQTAARNVSRQPYIEAARSLGAGEWRVLWWHMLPTLRGAMLAGLVLAFVYSLLGAAALSFLGLGEPPGTPEWGALLFEGRQVFRIAPWVAAAPGAAITLLVLLARWAASAEMPVQ
jgi:peptide/nickel transport system permease protein